MPAKKIVAMLLAGGKKTGLFTSPHLVRINERFQINGEDVSDEQFLDAFLKVEKAAKEYEAEGMNEEEARETVKQNLIMTTLPKLPESGDLSESDPVLIDMKAMGQCLHFGKSVQDNGYGMFRNMLDYKLAWKGKELVKIDRFFPSSKKCSKCGKIKKELGLSERVYRCTCGNEMDRDRNAAINIREEARRMLTA